MIANVAGGFDSVPSIRISNVPIRLCIHHKRRWNYMEHNILLGSPTIAIHTQKVIKHAQTRMPKPRIRIVGVRLW